MGSAPKGLSVASLRKMVADGMTQTQIHRATGQNLGIIKALMKAGEIEYPAEFKVTRSDKCNKKKKPSAKGMTSVTVSDFLLRNIGSDEERSTRYSQVSHNDLLQAQERHFTSEVARRGKISAVRHRNRPFSSPFI